MKRIILRSHNEQKDYSTWTSLGFVGDMFDKDKVTGIYATLDLGRHLSYVYECVIRITYHHGILYLVLFLLLIFPYL